MDDGLTFSRKYRLLDRQAFDRVFADPVRLTIPPFTLLFRENQMGHPRLGMVIAKKNLRLSVRRNAVRRKVRETFRLSKGRLPGVDLVLIARRDIVDFSAPQLVSQLNKIWTRLADD
ncbi:MAG: ribonuclease P protein component [Gammaproteobacteria bacterium]